MIGKMLQLLTVEEEDRILCTPMRPGSYTSSDEKGPCLVGTIIGDILLCSGKEIDVNVRERFMFIAFAGDPVSSEDEYSSPDTKFVEHRYDTLCTRFGTAKINNIIRNRILTNRIHKTLTTPVHHYETVS